MRRLRTLAVTLPIASLIAVPALANDPKPHADIVAGGEIMETGSFECTGSAADGKTRWDCPAQTFDSKFAQAPSVDFSIAGFSKVAIPGDSGLSIAVATNGDVTQQGFTPALDTTLTQAAGADKSIVKVNWTAIGAGQRVKQRTRHKEPRVKQRE